MILSYPWVAAFCIVVHFFWSLNILLALAGGVFIMSRERKASRLRPRYPRHGDKGTYSTCTRPDAWWIRGRCW